MHKTKIGVVGCGNISGIYLQADETFEILETVACADLVMERAREQASKYNVLQACTTEELLADPGIEIVLNLTNPGVHAQVAMQAVDAGKSVYNEKPLTLTRDEACRLLKAADARGVLVGGAPDTFLGAGLQTCRKLIDDGWIGEPIGATAFMLCHGHESWHPNPDYYYQPGAGPLFDMGPYYLTALVALMGPVSRVSGAARITFAERTITSQPLYGAKIEVNTPTHVASTLEFANGAIGTLLTSFDVWSHELPFIEIYGTQGSMSVPDPNTFGGPVRVRRASAEAWSDVPLTHGYAANSRGIGAADMAYALRSGRPHRASGQLAYHVLDIMHATLESAREGRRIELDSACDRPAPLPLGLLPGTLDE